MDEPRKRTLRYVLGVLAVVLAVGTIFAATALAGGGNASSPGTPTKAKATPTAKAPAQAKAHSGRGGCRREFATSAPDV
jgi:hypothetical protein